MLFGLQNYCFYQYHVLRRSSYYLKQNVHLLILNLKWYPSILSMLETRVRNIWYKVRLLSNDLLSFQTFMQAVTNLLNNESISDIDRLRLVMLYALRYEKESPVQLMQLFNKLASRSAKYKPGVK
jgi:hypothetical protein